MILGSFGSTSETLNSIVTSTNSLPSPVGTNGIVPISHSPAEGLKISLSSTNPPKDELQKPQLKTGTIPKNDMSSRPTLEAFAVAHIIVDPSLGKVAKAK